MDSEKLKKAKELEQTIEKITGAMERINSGRNERFFQILTWPQHNGFMRGGVSKNMIGENDANEIIDNVYAILDERKNAFIKELDEL